MTIPSPLGLLMSIALAVVVGAVGACGAPTAADDPVKIAIAPTPTSLPALATTVALTGPTPTATPVPTPTAVPLPTATPTAVPLPEPTPTAVPLPEAEPTRADPGDPPAPGETAEPAPGPSPIPTAVVSTQAGSPQQIANGAEIYTVTCARCHPESGMAGFAGPGLIGVSARFDHDGLVAELTHGHPVTFGFADKLSAEDISSVASYVLSAFG